MASRPSTEHRQQPGCGAAVPLGTRIYAIGDSHGCADMLRALHAEILDDCNRADEAANESGAPAVRRLAVYLGDYVDRGPDSRGLIDSLLADPLPGFESIHLLGNHDLYMRQFLEGGGDLGQWKMNGATETLRSYGVELTGNNGSAEAAAQLRAAFAAQVPAAHRRFLDGLGLSHSEGDYLFVHAGVRPGVALEAQDPDDLVWIRDDFLNSQADHGKIVVHGHSLVKAPEERSNRIGIDTGACFGGALTALVLEGETRRFLQIESRF